MPELEKKGQNLHFQAGSSSSKFRPLTRNVAIVALACCYLVFRSFLELKHRSAWGSGLSPSYALCSSDGSTAIYTVDANNSVAECVYVKEERFTDVGSLGDQETSCATEP